jgi:hypothetical protein
MMLCVALAGSVWAQLGHSGDGRNRWVRLNNYSNYSVVAVYAVPSYHRVARIDSPDLIPNTVIQPGRYYEVNFDLGNRECVLDIRAAGSDGSEWVFRSVNVCSMSDLNLRN